MLCSVEQAFVRRDERRAPLKTPAWEAISAAQKRQKLVAKHHGIHKILPLSLIYERKSNGPRTDPCETPLDHFREILLFL